MKTQSDADLRASECVAVLRDVVTPEQATIILDAKLTLATVTEVFQQNPALTGAIFTVGEELHVIGVLSRQALANHLSRQYVPELYRRKPFTRIAADWQMTPLLFSEDDAIAMVLESAMQRPVETRYEPVIACGQDGSMRLIEVHRLLLAHCGVLTATLHALELQRQATRQAEEQRARLQEQLLAASRAAGRAEVATGVLHNVGNVLNSITVSLSVFGRTLQQSKLNNLVRALGMIREQQENLSRFLVEDERGKILPGYLAKVADVLVEEQKALEAELAVVGRSVEHIRQIVQLQQSYAKGGANVGPIEPVRPAVLVEEALRVNLVSFDRHNVKVKCEFDDVPAVPMDRHKVLQVLVNLISNAKNATKHRDPQQREITVRISMPVREQRSWVRFEVTDNGVGIAPENLTRIFAHGFTTRPDGHGFGLHSSANAAAEMGGSITARSDGPGTGATFVFEFPVDAGVVAPDGAKPPGRNPLLEDRQGVGRTDRGNQPPEGTPLPEAA